MDELWDLVYKYNNTIISAEDPERDILSLTCKRKNRLQATKVGGRRIPFQKPYWWKTTNNCCNLQTVCKVSSFKIGTFSTQIQKQRLSFHGKPSTVARRANQSWFLLMAKMGRKLTNIFHSASFIPDLRNSQGHFLILRLVLNSTQLRLLRWWNTHPSL